MAWRLIFALAVLYSWFIYKIDINNAFTQSDIDINTIYITPPENNPKYKDKVLLLNKALYRLKQSARLQFITLKDILIEKFGFKPILSESYVLINKELQIIIYIYVDDLAIISPNIDNIKSFISNLKRYFKLKDLGPITDYLGINIDYDINKGIMKLS